jgi:hypothetical protein
VHNLARILTHPHNTLSYVHVRFIVYNKDPNNNNNNYNNNINNNNTPGFVHQVKVDVGEDCGGVVGGSGHDLAPGVYNTGVAPGWVGPRGLTSGWGATRNKHLHARGGGQEEGVQHGSQLEPNSTKGIDACGSTSTSSHSGTSDLRQPTRPARHTHASHAACVQQSRVRAPVTRAH